MKITFSYPDRLEFETLYEEVFKKHTYYVDLPKNDPVIFDCGANIGLTSVYFHQMYSAAQITCIEPNPTALTYLSKNLAAHDVHNVIIIPKALVGKKGGPSITLYTHPSWTVFASTHRGGWTEDQAFHPVQVETIHLSELLTKPVDILKIDIEGAETDVIEEAQDKLSLVAHCLIEFHETATHKSVKILRILRSHFKHVEVDEDKRKEKKKSNRLLFIRCYN